MFIELIMLGLEDIVQVQLNYYPEGNIDLQQVSETHIRLHREVKMDIKQS